MKMVTVHNINNYSIQPTDVFLFDCNVWMYIYCGIGSSSASTVSDYSNFYAKVKTAGNQIVINTLLISEFINSYSRLEFGIKKQTDGLQNFKRDFRDNPAYKPILDNINLITEKKILGNCIKIHDNFHEFEESSFFSTAHSFDFNDEYYIKLAEKKGYKVVTNDRDFQNSNTAIEVITR